VQPDTIIPGMLNPQNWNRFSYVRNSPIRYTDPTGHAMKTDDLVGQCNPFTQDCISDITDDINISEGGGNSLSSLNSSNNNPYFFSGSAGTIGGIMVGPGWYSGSVWYTGSDGMVSSIEYDIPLQNNSNLPDPLFEQLMRAGVSEEFLNSVSIVVTVPYDPACWKGNPAVTFGNTITFCGSQYHDTAHVTPALIHELVHVRQYQSDPGNFWWKQPWAELGGNSPYEAEAYACSNPLWDFYYGRKDYPPLNAPPCNLP